MKNDFEAQKQALLGEIRTVLNTSTKNRITPWALPRWRAWW